jgi:hypothetical protein
MSLKFSKKEVKIVLTFFIISFIFIHWSGLNETSLFDLTRAIVDEGRLEIDNYYNDTTDRSFYNNHYYSNKPIGLPLLSVPIHASWKFIYYSFVSQSTNNNKSLYNYDYIPIIAGNDAKIFVYSNLDLLIKISMILVALFTSSLFSALTVLLIYKMSNYFIKKEKYRILVIIIYGLATLAFPYATSMYSHPVATFFIFFSFYLLFKVKFDKLSNKYIIFAGLASGCAIITDHLSLIIGLLLLIYLLTFNRKKKIIIVFLLANLLAISPVLVYNFFIFGTPFESIYKYLDPTVYIESCFTNRNTAGYNISFEPFIILRLLFFPHLGLFFYYPILILSFYGLIEMYKKYKVETLFIIVSFLLTTVLVSMHTFWHSGNFGPRFLLVIVPFFVIPFFYLFEKINLKVILPLLIVSLLVNLSSTIEWTYVIKSFFEICCCISPSYASDINTFEILINPIFEKNIPNLFETGPRSRLIESFLTQNYSFDIRDYLPTIRHMETPRIFNIKLFKTPFGFLVMKVSFITITLVTILLTLIWQKDAIKFVLTHKYLFTILFLISLFYFFNITEMIYEKNWFSKEFYNVQTNRWMSDNATLVVYSPEDEKVKLQFSFWNLIKNNTMEVYLNDKLVKTYELNVNETRELTTPLLELRKGENAIRFHSVEGCDVPNAMGAWKNDFRCLSFNFVSDIKKLKLESIQDKPIFDNWFDEEKGESGNFRWMSNESNVTYYTLNETKLNLKFDITSYYKNRQLDVYVNDVFSKRLSINSSWNRVAISVNLNKEDNIITFHSVEGCDIPARIENSTDERCLSFALRNIFINK